MARVKLGLSGLNALQLMLKAQNIIASMNGNSNFVTPLPTLADVQAAADNLAVAAQEAESGSHYQISVRNSYQLVLENLLRDLAAYVQNTAQGDEIKIMSSGFEVVHGKTPVGPLPAPENVEGEHTGVPGEVRVTWNPVPHARGYILEMTTANPADPATVWMEKGHSTESRQTVSGLTPGQYYWFRVKAWGTPGVGAPSDPASIMAT